MEEKNRKQKEVENESDESQREINLKLVSEGKRAKYRNGHIYISPIYEDENGNIYQKIPEGDFKLIHTRE